MSERASTRQWDGSDMVQVAFANDAGEAEIVRALLDGREIPSYLQPVGVEGPTLGYGLLNSGARRVMVRPDHADAARDVIESALVNGGAEAMPDIANATHLEKASGRGPRDYGVVGGYARAILWSVASMVLFATVFLLLRGV